MIESRQKELLVEYYRQLDVLRLAIMATIEAADPECKNEDYSRLYSSIQTTTSLAEKAAR